MITKTKDPEESVVLEFDFSSELAAIDSATVSVAVAGTKPDANASLVLDGPLQINGTDVFQRMSGGVDGVDYKFRCAGTRGSDVIVRTGIVKVRAA